ncbi:MAG: EpsG family protein [Olsenella sp.]|nr:EpsG family protein [Olsenella sp.]
MLRTLQVPFGSRSPAPACHEEVIPLLPYAVCFLLTGLALHLGERRRDAWGRALLVVGLLLPVLLATLRAPSVGRDVGTYLAPLSEQALRASDPVDYFSRISWSGDTRDIEPLFALLVFVSTKTAGGIWGTFFLLEALNMGLVFSAAKLLNARLRKIGARTVSVALCVTLYLFLFYNLSLSVFRQSLAFLIGLVAILLFTDGKVPHAVAGIVLAMLVHSTSVFCLVIFAVWQIARKRWFKLAHVLAAITFLVTAFGKWTYGWVMNTINMVVPVPGRYLSAGYMASSINVNKAWLYLVVVMIALVVATRVIGRPDEMDDFFYLVVLFAVALFPLGVISANAGRILYYLFAFFPLVMAKFATNGCFDVGRRRQVVCIGLLVAAVVYWVGTIGVSDYTDTAQYVLAFM